MSQPLVSIIIPCYKQAHFLNKAIDSCIQQAYQNLEIIVIDDGSPDNISEVMSLYTDNARIQLINKQNQGVAAARNTGIDFAKGSYMQFLDADDWLHPQKITRQVEFLEANPTLGFVYCDFYIVYNENEFSDAHSVSQSLGPLEPEIFNTLWMDNCVPYLSALVRREWIERAGPFKLGFEGCEDYEFWMRLAALGCKVRYIPERLVYYRRHENNTSNNTEHMRKVRNEARKQIAAEFPDQVSLATDFSFRRYIEVSNDIRAWAAQLEETIIDVQQDLRRVWADKVSLEANFISKNKYINWLETLIADKDKQIIRLETLIADSSKPKYNPERGEIYRLKFILNRLYSKLLNKKFSDF